jgi:hypothetical protein
MAIDCLIDDERRTGGCLREPETQRLPLWGLSYHTLPCPLLLCAKPPGFIKSFSSIAATTCLLQLLQRWA